jgi:HAMP domain-containing protein/HPt (histidine-containing phosphotransfer) domain-containing protein
VAFRRLRQRLVDLRLRSQLVVVAIFVGALPLAVVGSVAQRASADALTAAAMAQVEAIRIGRQSQLEQVFAQVAGQAASLGEDTMIVDGARAFISAFQQIADDASPAQIAAARDSVSSWYADTFAAQLRRRHNDIAVDLDALVPSDANSLLAQQRYIADNPQPPGDKHHLDAVGTDAYAQVHGRLHPLLRSYLERFGYYDIFIIDPATDVVVYTTFKETDFGQRLHVENAPHDGLVRAYMRARAAPAHSVHFEDYAPYVPSYGDAAAFVSTPVFDSNNMLIAVLAMQLPVDRINAVVNGETGLGRTGHAFVVGRDHRLRSQDNTSGEPTIFVQRIDNEAVVAASSGSSGVGRYLAHGKATLGAWAPLHIGELPWALVVEVSEDEALASVRALSRKLWVWFGVCFVSLSALALWIGGRLAQRLGHAVSTAQAVARGDFSTPIVVDSADEVGDLSRALLHMRDALASQLRSIESQAAALQVLLDSTGDALIPIDREGRVLTGVSTIASTWFGPVEPGMRICEVLCSGAVERVAFELGFLQLCDDLLPFEVLAAQMPARLHRNGCTYQLAYRRIGGDVLERVLIIVRDVTALVQSEERESDFRQAHQAMQVISRDRDGFRRGLQELDRLLLHLERAWEDTPECRRALHTIKGSAAVLGFTGVADACHALEDQLDVEPERVKGASFSVVRDVWLRVLGQIEGFLGEDNSSIRIEEGEYQLLLRRLNAHEHHDDISAFVRSLKDEPARSALKRLGVQATRVAQQLCKPICVSTVDNGLRLPPGRFEELWLSAIHVVRNAVDHGLESVDERHAAAKDKTGTITLSTTIVHDSLVIACADDGRGIDWERVRNKAAQRGMACTTHDDLVDAMFSDGLSTRDEVSEWSGRGVGLGAVKEAVTALQGSVRVSSTIGIGTTIELVVPLRPGLPSTRSSPKALFDAASSATT